MTRHEIGNIIRTLNRSSTDSFVVATTALVAPLPRSDSSELALILLFSCYFCKNKDEEQDVLVPTASLAFVLVPVNSRTAAKASTSASGGCIYRADRRKGNCS